jgi:hypothetical protein
MLNMLGKAEANKSNPDRATRDAVAEMKAMADVHSVMDILKFIEIRYASLFLSEQVLISFQVAHCWQAMGHAI